MTPINTDRFIISVAVEGITRYLGIDRASGGYPYWSDYFSSAEQFSKEKADSWIEDFKAQASKEPVKSSDGTLAPPHEIYRLLGLNNLRTKATGIVRVELLIRSPILEITISGEIKKPTGFVY